MHRRRRLGPAGQNKDSFGERQKTVLCKTPFYRDGRGGGKEQEAATVRPDVNIGINDIDDIDIVNTDIYRRYRYRQYRYRRYR